MNGKVVTPIKVQKYSLYCHDKGKYKLLYRTAKGEHYQYSGLLLAINFEGRVAFDDQGLTYELP